MLFTITGKHMTISDGLRSRAQERTEKLPKYYNGVNQVEVIIDGSEGGHKSVEVIARGEHGNVFVATEVGDDAYQCIDLAVHKLEQQLRKKKTKERDKKHVGGRQVVEEGE
ncbi:MAG: ribosome-associated translation inhibitor RaiA [Sedimentisphaerales bacterium]|nr:ribosome-associated translation inhibitor RaiA [Sedimentisphaerales bacterium]